LIERASDLADIDRRVLLHLLGESDGSRALPEDAILVADDLLPSQLTGLNRDHVAGICLAGGGPTSHVSIMAASMGIPALVAVGPDALRIPERAAIILDCEVGAALVHPSPEELREAAETVAKRRRRSEENRKLAQADCRTADGVRIQVMANLGALADVAPALANGAEGCGLLRSEFLFIDRPTAPDENEQFAQYQSIASALEGRPLVIRTLDAGGDKDLPYINLPRSDNPALGLRGVRMSFWQPDLLRAQLRAILRVRPVGQCAILLPMIATLGDLRTVRAMLDEEKARLKVSAEVPLGIMVEVPSAALISEQLAAEADFLSVGTNDLTQYTFAMDRTSAPLAKYLDPFHPAILHLIAATARGAERHRRWVGVCGGLASQPLAAPLLIGLGATELSVIPQVVARIKALVHGLTMADCREAARHALTLESGEAVRDFLAKRWPDA
jgi:phosphocarrier protein FPr/phosphocarrier protein